jgi:ribosomal protein L12E/L44/L45/RPP1/RPP2
MPSKFIPGAGKFHRQSIKEQIRMLNSKVAAVASGGKLKNTKAAFADAKKKAGTMKTGSQRGS